jgi:TetR/AcrR family acrAB operon transcriptional repressor
MPKRNTENRPERILNAAANLIVRYGYDRTTIADIAAEAGIAKGAVYLHWSSKDALFDALLKREMIRLMDDLLARVEADPVGGTLPRMYRHSLQALQANPLMLALYTRDSRVLGNYMHGQDANRYSERFSFGKTFIEFLQSAGLVRADMPPAGLAYLLSVISLGYTQIETIIPADQAPPVEEFSRALELLMESGAALPANDSQPGKAALRMGVETIHRQYAASEKGNEVKEG